MRRMFQGRMISVNSCGKRMQANWNCYLISKDNDRGYTLANIRRTAQQEGSELSFLNDPNRATLNFAYPVKANHTYLIKPTKPGYECFYGGIYVDNALAVVSSTWGSEIEVIPAINGGIYISLANVNHDLPLTIGECGITIEEVR